MTRLGVIEVAPGSTIRLGVLVLAVMLVASWGDRAQGADYVKLNNKGNKLVEEGKLDQALDEYREASVERPDVPEIDYNIGNVYHLRNQYDSAATEYQDALATLEGPVQPSAFYNLGNTLFRMQKYDLAAESYKRALMENPHDKDAKYNLELAMQRMKEDSTKQQQQQGKDKQNQPDSSQQNQDQKQQQNKDQDNKSDSTQQQQNQQQQQQADSSQMQQQPQSGQEQQDAAEQQQQGAQPKGMTKEDAQRILDALRQRELQVQKQRAQREATAGTPGKDW